MMMKWFCRTLLVPISTGCLFAAGFTEGETVYAFRAVEITTQTKWGDAPVVAAGRWGLRVDTPAGIKRASYAGNFRINPKVGYATEIVEVNTFEISLNNRREEELQSQAMGELQQYQSGTDLAIANVSAGDRNISASTEQQIERLNDNYEDLEELIRQTVDDGDYGSLELKDSIVINLELNSPRDIEDAFCVILVGYNAPNPKAPEGREFKRIGRINRIGDLKANTVEKSKLRMRVPAGYLKDAIYGFHLLTGENANIATTKSTGLRELTEDELAALLQSVSPPRPQ